ncbi:tRNA(Met) cytidine acetyltransferase [Alteromonas aestuariivivens]|uniref:tRNA(Met) cytidine acetyltransferase n=1 Tax=Alteromonas aestuariivivens TaxID=1938339 RepID=A0A3D8M649_9ALTE|nr:GNAT family N-acetyltransferase [Alteromonas aestuariivivens]RDV25136.1 tRNA(Met) cytidine acetyltransferase [Alteromonas aestuariivivens]
MAFESVLEWIRLPLQHDTREFRRQLLIISAGRDWCYRQATALIALLNEEHKICVLGNLPDAGDIQRPVRLYRNVLGQEYDIVIYDAFCDFRPNALLALSGTLKGAGSMIILCPPFDDWPRHRSTAPPHFLSFGHILERSRTIASFVTGLKSETHVSIWQENNLKLAPRRTSDNHQYRKDNFANSEQAQVYQAILAAFDTHSRVVTLSAPRGRGKSYLLGLIAQQFLNRGTNVTLVGPLQDSTNSFFAAFSTTTHQYRMLTKRCYEHTGTKARVTWLAPDNPKMLNQTHAMLIIDEAASLPLPVLKALCPKGEKLLLATTTSGYEGSGQGFLTRFIPWLKRRYQIAGFELTAPIRWSDNDFIEPFLNRWLNYESASRELPAPSVETFRIRCLPFSEMDDALLLQTMSLLKIAHYQTTPDDMMRLADSPDSLCITMEQGERLIGAAALSVEGGFKLKEVADGIASGKRRVKGHLGAQALALISADPAIACLNYWRINRVAVVPSLQHKGLGSQLLAHITELARTQNIDAVITSFGATRPLIRFWERNNFGIYRIGHKPDKSSGEKSILMGMSTGRLNHDYITALGCYDAQNGYGASLNGTHSTIINGAQFTHPIAEALHLRRVKQFVAGFRNLEQMGGSGFWIAYRTSVNTRVSPIIADTFLNRLTIPELVKRHRMKGHREFINAIRLELKRVYPDLFSGES